MDSHDKHGFIYYGGTFMERPPIARWSQSLTDRERTIDFGFGTLTMSPEAAESFTRSWISMMTEHPISLETLDKVLYLLEECRFNHPDADPWNNAPVPSGWAAYVAEKRRLGLPDRTDPDNEFPVIPPYTDDDAPEV